MPRKRYSTEQIVTQLLLLAIAVGLWVNVLVNDFDQFRCRQLVRRLSKIGRGRILRLTPFVMITTC
ncbi:MAG: hypothetical protein CL476_11165 [Acidobacteria bacterium]|jgi:hypothetical protein|nr:hypothetical protein [Acidobacteriota bacterium]